MTASIREYVFILNEAPAGCFGVDVGLAEDTAKVGTVVDGIAFETNEDTDTITGGPD